jgi:peptidoglycan/LPS O-acetylase OafA/YrhL
MAIYLNNLSATDRDNNIGLIRFLLATLVVFSHSYPFLLGSNQAEPISIVTHGQRTGGELAVDCFFILSGYLITGSWYSSHCACEYLKRRILRIYPGFLAAILFSATIAAPLLYDSAYWPAFSWRNFIADGLNLTYITELTTINGGSWPVNGSLWSIRYEFLCYATVMLFGITGLLGRRILVLLAWLTWNFLYMGQTYCHMRIPGNSYAWLIGDPGTLPTVFSNFLAGCTLYCYRDRIPFTKPLLTVAVLALFATGIILPQFHALALTMPLFCAYILLFLAYVPGPILRHDHGDLSYGLYLYAFPVQLLLAKTIPWLTPLTLFPLAMLTTLPLAVLSWHYIEHPCLGLKRPREPRVPLPIFNTQPEYQHAIHC